MAKDTHTLPSLEMNDFLTALNLDHANIKDINFYHERGGGVSIHLILNPQTNECPICHTMTNKIKGYKVKKIIHSVLNPLSCTIFYNARRYVCPTCGKTFYENNPFSFSGSNFSIMTVYNVLKELKRPEATFTYVAEKYHLSASSVSNIFDNHVNVSRRTLPECICFDETYAFKSEDSAYICVLLDYIDKKIIDILPSRRKQNLLFYFNQIPLEERKKVKYVSFDMWETYRIVSQLMFPNCIMSVDKFHVLQELTKRVQQVRIKVMNKNKKTLDYLKKEKQEKGKLKPEQEAQYKEVDQNYYLLKTFNRLLFSNSKAITDPNYRRKYNKRLGRYLNLYEIYDMILEIDDDLKEAIDIRDRIHSFYRDTDYKNAKQELENIIILCRSSSIEQINGFANTLIRWKNEIINSFILIPSIKKKVNNSLIENRNKSIKLLKHSSNGYTNWERFRNRVLYCLNDDVPIKITPNTKGR